MFWEWSELNLAWYLMRADGLADVAKMTLRKDVAILYIYGLENRVKESHRFGTTGLDDTGICAIASELYRAHLKALASEAETITVKAKD